MTAEVTPALRILYLEDDPLDRRLLEATLRADDLACELIFAKTKAEFQNALQWRQFDVIISDFTLPSFDGMSALTLAQRACPDVPFMFFSGTIGEDRAIASLKAGAIDYVLKDNVRQLAPAVRRALKQVEERQRRRDAEEALKESNARFEQMAAAIDQVCWLSDTAGGQMLYVSPAYEKIWGRPGSSMSRQPDRWIETVHASDQERIRRALRRESEDNLDETYRILCLDGSVRWVRDRTFPIRDDAGRVYRVVGTVEDVTERLALEEQLRHSQKLEAVGMLAGGVAHDFNNLLTVIQGNAEMALARTSEDSNREHLNQIIKASLRAAELTGQLLTFSRKQTIHRRPLNLNDIIGNLTRMLERLLGPQTRISSDLSPALPLALADAGMIEQAIVNLSVNARDAMPQGGKMSIATQGIHLDETQAKRHPEARPGEFVSLTVSDTGVGIPPENLARLFEPFFTTKQAGKGTGFGLAIVYAIVKQHQGWVEVSSRVGSGTTFTLFLPVLLGPVEAAEGAYPPAVLRGGSETILVVEDESTIRLLTRRTLEAYGYRVLEAGSAQEAIKIFQTDAASQITLLLTDMFMTGRMTGRDLATRLSAQRPGLKVIVVSGHPNALADCPELAPRTAFLQKPYTLRTLIETVRNRLDQS